MSRREEKKERDRSTVCIMRLSAVIIFGILTVVIAAAACIEGINANSMSDDTLHENEGKGRVLFWQDGKPAYGLTIVTIEGESKEVTRDISTGDPLYNTSGCALFTLPSGIYTYSAKEAFPGTATWTGTVTITEDSCLSVELH